MNKQLSNMADTSQYSEFLFGDMLTIFLAFCTFDLAVFIIIWIVNHNLWPRSHHNQEAIIGIFDPYLLFSYHYELPSSEWYQDYPEKQNLHTHHDLMVTPQTLLNIWHHLLTFQVHIYISWSWGLWLFLHHRIHSIWV